MTHEDNVIGFGQHMPDFIAAPVTLPAKGKAAKDDVEDDVEDSDDIESTDDIEEKDGE